MPQGLSTSSPQTFSEIFDDYRVQIFRYLLKLTESEAEADDLTQETFVRINQGLPKFKGDSSLTTWIYRIATNVSNDYFRGHTFKQKKMSYPLDEVNLNSSAIRIGNNPSSAHGIAQSEMSACVQSFISELPPNLRTVLVLHDIQGFRNREIAEILQCSLGAVKTRLHRARKELRTKLRSNCNFTHDEQNVFVCEPISKDRSIAKLDCL